jgi:hypothetical protein
VGILRNFEGPVGVFERSFQMPILGVGIAFFIVLRRGPVCSSGKRVIFSGLSVQAGVAVAFFVHDLPPMERVLRDPPDYCPNIAQVPAAVGGERLDACPIAGSRKLEIQSDSKANRAPVLF